MCARCYPYYRALCAGHLARAQRHFEALAHAPWLAPYAAPYDDYLIERRGACDDHLRDIGAREAAPGPWRLLLQGRAVLYAFDDPDEGGPLIVAPALTDRDRRLLLREYGVRPARALGPAARITRSERVSLRGPLVMAPAAARVGDPRAARTCPPSGSAAG
jgi:hypothetical protein